MKYSSLYIKLRGKDTIDLKFRLLENPVTNLWIERMMAKAAYPLDHPRRFYGFDSVEVEQTRAQNQLLECVDIINSHSPIITKSFTSITDQDYLNYLHNIFERYHGLLDCQDHQYWLDAPDNVRKALANLNLSVHRCETATRFNYPRFVCTWFGLPKTKTLSTEDMQLYGNVNPAFGSVCINYAEIGKTLEDLTIDNDQYIADDAFKPFNHASADFVVRFFEEDVKTVEQRIASMQRYYDTNRDFFKARGFNNFHDPRLLPYRFPVAQLVESMPRDRLLSEIQQRQYIEEVVLV